MKITVKTNKFESNFRINFEYCYKNINQVHVVILTNGEKCAQTHKLAHT